MDSDIARRVLMVDLENIQRIDLSGLPADAHVMVFYGAAQRKLPEELVVQAQPLGARLKWVKITGQGPNALDFHIAFYLGQILADQPNAECAVFSYDTGFDPLMCHVQAIGRACRRVATLEDAFTTRKQAESDQFHRLLGLLKKEESRPTKRKGLMGKLRSWFPDLTEEARQGLMQRLFDESIVRESERILAFLL